MEQQPAGPRQGEAPLAGERLAEHPAVELRVVLQVAEPQAELLAVERQGERPGEAQRVVPRVAERQAERLVEGRQVEHPAEQLPVAALAARRVVAQRAEAVGVALCQIGQHPTPDPGFDSKLLKRKLP